MTENYHLAKELLLMNYGQVVADVGGSLLEKHPIPMSVISRTTKRNLALVKKALCVLIQHKYVSFTTKPGRDVVLYTANINKIIQLANIPRAIFTTRNMYSQEEELIVEKLIQHGEMKTSTLIKSVMDQLKEMDGELTDQKAFKCVKLAFDRLWKAHFIKRENRLRANGNYPIPTYEEENPAIHYIPVHITLEEVMSSYNQSKEDVTSEPSSKKKKEEVESTPVSPVFWTINNERYQQAYRDEIIAGYVSNKYDVVVGEMVRAMLRYKESEASIDKKELFPFNVTEMFGFYNREMSKFLPRKTEMSLSMMINCWRELRNIGEGIVIDDGVEQTNSFGIDFKRTFQLIAADNAYSWVEQRYGEHATLICRLLHRKKRLDIDAIGDMSMLPLKVCKALVYKMLSDHVIGLEELSRHAGNTTRKNNLHVFHVDMQTLARDLLNRSYKAARNSLILRKMSRETNKRSLLLREKLDTIKENMEDEEEKAAMDNEMDDSVRNALNKHDHLVDQTFQMQLNGMETAFIFNTYLDLNAPQIIIKTKKGILG